MRIPMMLWANNVTGASQFRPAGANSDRVNHATAHDSAMEPLRWRNVVPPEFGSRRRGCRVIAAFTRHRRL
jgi:hypothetical protein